MTPNDPEMRATETWLRAHCADESPIDVDEHARRITRVVVAAKRRSWSAKRIERFVAGVRR